MATDSLVETSKKPGPNGFLECNQSYFTVSDGKICAEDGTVVGILYENGVIQGKSAPFDGWTSTKSIEEVPGCTFKGIDRSGLTLELPRASSGPTGLLIYNHVPHTVIKGRIATYSHDLVGEIDDNAVITLRACKNPAQLIEIKETSQLQTDFKGVKSDGSPYVYAFERPLHKQKDKPYSENEIITYFDLDWHKLNEKEKAYIVDSLRLWTRTGWLQIVRKATGAGRAMFGNVRHGASGVTGVLTAYVTIDRGEFETEIRFFENYGILSRHKRAEGSEIRVNLVVSHEFGHQLEMTLSQACRDRIQNYYDAKIKLCKEKHPPPPGFENGAEMLQDHQIEDRCFISGYSRTSMHEYWAEALAAFSMYESRYELKRIDPQIHDLLVELVFSPETLLSPGLQEMALELQASLRVGGELTDDLLNK